MYINLCLCVGACDFEQDFCTWVATGTGSFGWFRGANQTATANTGPQYDHTIGNAAGKCSSYPTSRQILYMYKILLHVCTWEESTYICTQIHIDTHAEWYWYYMYCQIEIISYPKNYEFIVIEKNRIINVYSRFTIVNYTGISEYLFSFVSCGIACRAFCLSFRPLLVCWRQLWLHHQSGWAHRTHFTRL